MGRNVAGRLFSKRANALVEHPVDIPVEPMQITIGEIQGWHAFAPAIGRGRGRAEIIGPFIPIVKVENGHLYIETEDGTQFWYADGKNVESYHPQVPCWYQSGVTLRFYKVPDNWTEEDIKRQVGN